MTAIRAALLSVLAAGVVGAAPGSAVPAGCVLRAVQPGVGGELTIDEPDDAAAPTAWQGPINVGSCHHSPEAGIIAGPFLSNGHGKLFYREYSGSNQWAVLLDTTSCRAVWKSRSFGSGRLAYRPPATLVTGPRQVVLRSDCTPR